MKFDIDEQSKTKEGREAILMELYRNRQLNTQTTNDELCWEMYHNLFEASEYDYLRTFGDYELPASVKHIPKQRPYIDYLVGKQSRRPFVFSVSVSDRESIKRKYKSRIDDLVKRYQTRYKEKYYGNIAKIQELESVKQKLQQQAMAEPQSEEEAQQIEQIKMQLPSITSQIEFIKDQIQNDNAFSEEEIKKLDRYYKYENKEYVEELAQKCIKRERTRLNIRNISTRNFIASVVVGKETYYIDYRPGDNKCIYKSVLPNKVFYQSTEDVEWIQDLDWAGFEEQLPLSSVLTEFGDELTSPQKEILKNKYKVSSNTTSGIFVATEGQGAVLDTRSIRSGGVSSDDGVNVVRVFWKVERKIRAIRKPNPHQKGKYFTDYISDEYETIDETKYSYNRKERYWVNKDDEQIKKKFNEVKTYNPSKGDKNEVRYVYDLYRGIVIDDTILITKKSDTQPRYIDDLSMVKLPIIGKTYNNIDNLPHSLVWATKDIQKLYNIVTYHKELMLAVAGTKTLMLDRVQKPEGMSDEEWRYKIKMGIAEIQTRKKGLGPHMQPTFNQFQVFDMSLSNSIQYLDAILENLDQQMGMIMGVTRQAMGQVQHTDQVGTFQLSQQSSAFVTEILFYNHDQVEKEALNMLMHLSKTYLWDKETIMQIDNLDGSQEIIKVPANLLNLSDYEIKMLNNTKEESSVAELKQIALNKMMANAISLESFVAIYKMENLIEIESMARQISEKQQEMAALSGQRQVEAEQQLKQMEIELENKYKMEIENQKRVLEEAKLALDQKKLDMEQAMKDMEFQLKQQELDQNRYLKLFELVNEKESEDNAVAYNDKHATIDEQIRIIETKINAMLQARQLAIQKDDIDKYDKQQMKKIEVDKEKAKKITKEHVSDK